MGVVNMKTFIAIILIFVLVGSFQIYSWTSPKKNARHTQNAPRLAEGVKSILLHTTFFGSEDWGFGATGMEPFETIGCPVKNCFLTPDLGFGEDEIAKFDAVVFHLGDLHEIASDVLYQLRRADQRYVMFYLEAPYSLPTLVGYERFKGFFNWSMTYRRDSDVISPYGSVVPKQDEIESLSMLQAGFDPDSLAPSTRLAAHRPNLVLWFVSNCQSNSLRETYVLELQKFIQVDVFGSCGSTDCARNSDCDRELFQRYKFYLSFENAMCSDYATEKLFKALAKDIVPIVMGGSNYSQIAPPHSVIDVRDYPNPQDLADYLLELDDDSAKYLEYFWWKEYYLPVIPNQGWKVGFCHLCQRLHESHQEPNVILDPVHWIYIRDGGPVCLASDTLPWYQFVPATDEYLKGLLVLGSGCFMLLIFMLYALFRNDWKPRAPNTAEPWK
eukprot:maker-scaffold105_size367834-snap-gene-0.9 protein:Tk10176 transcript:maker-scaffold105_size367834-snap-gene-0.9-mRNA-1 annotation:"hypothetical protein DAPPUDRAFT_313010"